MYGAPLPFSFVFVFFSECAVARFQYLMSFGERVFAVIRCLLSGIKKKKVSDTMTTFFSLQGFIP